MFNDAASVNSEASSLAPEAMEDGTNGVDETSKVWGKYSVHKHKNMNHVTGGDVRVEAAGGAGARHPEVGGGASQGHGGHLRSIPQEILSRLRGEPAGEVSFYTNYIQQKEGYRVKDGFFSVLVDS